MRGKWIILACAIVILSIGTSESFSEESEIPDWLKNTIRLWLDGQISNKEFVNSMEYLQSKGIIHISNLENDEMTDQINYLKTKNDVIKEEVKQLRKENEDLKILVKSKDSSSVEMPTSFSKLFEEHEMLQKEVKRLRQVNSQFEEQFQSWLNTNNFQETNKSNTAEKRIEEINSKYVDQINNLKQDNANYKNQIDELSELSKSYEKQVGLLKSENENEKLLVEQLKLRNQENKENLNQSVQQTDSLQKSIDELKNENKKQSEKISEYENKINQLTQNIQNNIIEKGKFEDIVKKNTNVETESLKKIAELKDSNDQKDKTIIALKNELESQGSKIDSLTNQISSMESSIKKSESENKLKSSQIENDKISNQNKLKQAEAINKELLKSLSSVTSNAKESKEFLKNLNSQTQIYKDRIKELETQNSEYQNSINKLQIQNDDKILSAIDLKNNFDKATSQLKELNIKVEQFKNKIVQLEEENESYQSKIDKMELNKKSEDTITKLKDDTLSKNKEITLLKIKIDESDALVKSLNSKIVEFQDTIKSLENERNQYKSKILATQDKSTQGSGKSFDELSLVISTLREENKGYQELVDSFKKQNQELSSKMKSMVNDKSDRQISETELKNQNKNLQDQIVELQNQILQKNNQIQSLKPLKITPEPTVEKKIASEIASKKNNSDELDSLIKQNEDYVLQLNYYKAKTLVNEEELETLRDENEEFKTLINVLKNSGKESQELGKLDYNKINSDSIPGVIIHKTMDNIIQDKAELVKIDKNKEFLIFVNPDPSGFSNLKEQVKKATEFWNKNNGVKFRFVESQNDANIIIAWSQDIGNGYDGFTSGSKTIQIRLGSTECDSTWHPYSEDSLKSIIIHELGHFVGLNHSQDKSNVMYPIIFNAKYGIYENDYKLKSKESVFVKSCSFRSEASFDYEINVKDSKKVNFFFVPSITEKSQYDNKKTFNYYSDLSCMGIQKSSESNTCKNVIDSGGILIIAPEMKSGESLSVHVKIKEK